MSKGEGEVSRPVERLVLKGDSVSPGFGIGPAYVVDRRRVAVPHTHIEPDEIEAETGRFRGALRACQEQLEGIKGRLPHGEHRQILKAQQMMLRDPHLVQHTESLIRDEGINAEWAVAKATDEVRETLGQAEDEYFRERQDDVGFIAERLLRELAGEEGAELKPPEGAVIVALDLSPADTASLHRREVAAIVTQEGGHTSHTAIMARALKIPAVVGVDGILSLIESGDRVVVDAVHEQVVVRPTDEEVLELEGETERYQAFEAKVQKEHALPAMTQDGLHVTLRANLALDEEVEVARNHGAEGVGLYRTEYMYLGRDRAPTEEEHYRTAKSVLQRCAPYPVRFRTFDLGSDKTCRFFSKSEQETNPALGVRSLRLALRQREEFLAQLRGLLRAAMHGPLQIMLPLVSGIEEVRAGLDAVASARGQLAEAGMPHVDEVEVGVMIEVPSAAIVADLIAKHVDFMSVGTNDLIQYTLAIDRDNDDVNYLYEPLHPAIVRMIRNVVEAGKEAKIPVSLCGEMAADPRYTWVLVGLGLVELSMHGAAIPVVKNIIRMSSTDEMKALADQVLGAGSAAEAKAAVKAVMRERFPEHLEHGAGSAAED